MSSLNGSFKAASITIDATDAGYDVIVDVKESGLVSASFETQVNSRQGEPRVVLSARASNVNGRGEAVVIEGSRGNSDGSFSVSSSKPVVMGTSGSTSSPFKPLPLLSFTLHDNTSDFPFAGVKERSRACALDLRSFLDKRTSSRFGIEVSEKGVSGIQEEAILRHGLFSSFRKVCLHHSLDMDSRSFDGSNFPVSGCRVTLATQVASDSFFGNQSFLKNELWTQVNCSLWDSFFLVQGTLRAGFLADRKSCVTERFFLGGPMSVRGFAPWGIGHRLLPDSGALGSHAIFASGLHVYSRLPFLKPSFNRFLRLHAFFNAGNTVDDVLTDTATALRRLAATNEMRTSVGAGVVIQVTPFLRFEVNYSQPIRFVEGTDVTDVGWSFGFGATFT
jgi:outer membrane protein insertion porin family